MFLRQARDLDLQTMTFLDLADGLARIELRAASACPGIRRQQHALSSTQGSTVDGL